MSRGKYEESHLSSQQKRERAGLPPGIGLENSPLFDLPQSPWDLLPHLVRYYYVAEQLATQLVDRFPAPAKLSFLDVGCGMGEMRTMLYSYRFPKGYSKSYLGVDGDSIKLALARIHNPAGQFVEGLLPQVLEPLAEGFNGFICTEVFEHISREEGIATLEQMRRLSLPKGIAVFTVPSPSHSRFRENPLHINETTPEDFQKLATSTGWAVVNWFWLRAPNLPSLGENIPRPVQRLVSAAALKPEKVAGVDALYVLEAV